MVTQEDELSANVNAEDALYLLKFLYIFINCKCVPHVGRITWGI